uniref:Flocculation protein FLO11-like n=1 Tax=Mesocestoides corti TaxID=53468 RepID=A0A5K3FQF5_MESCO
MTWTVDPSWTATANGPTMDEESFLQVYKNKVSRHLIACATSLPDVGCRECRTGYFTNHEQCKEPIQKLRTASLLRARQCGNRSGHRNIGQSWPQQILCLSAIQWHARKISSQPEMYTKEVFGGSYGKTLAQIYLNIGLEPPSCLPNIETSSETSDTSESPTFNLHESNTSRKSPKTPISQILSPRSSRNAARNSLPRALFTESVVVSPQKATPCSSNSLTSSMCSFASTSFSQSSIRVETENNPRSKAVTPAPQLVLIPMSVSGKKESASKTRRKPRTPVKRDISLNKRSFATDASSRSASLKTPKARTSRGTPQRRSATRRSVPSRRRSEQSKNCQRKSLYRSVKETPNPKMSYPRWERARMAAAEKTKYHSVIVAESPIKPSEVGAALGSPLRRLRRASSFLNCERMCSSVGGSDSCLQSRAERWQKKQQEDEASLSQFGSVFSGGESTFSTLSQPPSLFRRQSSNLLANLQQSSQPSLKSPRRPTLNTIASSPSILSLQGNKASPHTNPVPSSNNNACMTTPPKHIISLAETASPIMLSTPTLRSSLVSGTGMTTAPKSRRTRGLTTDLREVPISPHVYDEAAMFLGQDEFLRQTTPSRETALLQRTKRQQNEPVCVPAKKRITLMESPYKPASNDRTVGTPVLLSPRMSDRRTPLSSIDNHSTSSSLRNYHERIESSSGFEISPNPYYCEDSGSSLLSPCKQRTSTTTKTPQKGLFNAAPILNFSHCLQSAKQINEEAMEPYNKSQSQQLNRVKLRPRKSLFR